MEQRNLLVLLGLIDFCSMFHLFPNINKKINNINIYREKQKMSEHGTEMV